MAKTIVEKTQARMDKVFKNKKTNPAKGLSKATKSATVKAAKKGADIGKPGKNFKKVAASAAKEYGSEKAGESVAAAAMWKAVKKKGKK